MTDGGAGAPGSAAIEDDRFRRLEAIIRGDPDLMGLLGRLRALDLPQVRVVSGCLYQTVWNVLTARPRRTGIKDYDVIYFDAADLSWQAEDLVIRRVAAAVDGLGLPVEVRNQARVHLWFEARFGSPYPALASADASLTLYASVVHAVGVRLEADGRLDIIAPFGLADIFDMIVRPNRALANEEAHRGKAARAKSIWPELVILPW